MNRRSFIRTMVGTAALLWGTSFPKLTKASRDVVNVTLNTAIDPQDIYVSQIRFWRDGQIFTRMIGFNRHEESELNLGNPIKLMELEPGDEIIEVSTSVDFLGEQAPFSMSVARTDHE